MAYLKIVKDSCSVNKFYFHRIIYIVKTDKKEERKLYEN